MIVYHDRTESQRIFNRIIGEYNMSAMVDVSCHPDVSNPLHIQHVDNSLEFDDLCMNNGAYLKFNSQVKSIARMYMIDGD